MTRKVRNSKFEIRKKNREKRIGLFFIAISIYVMGYMHDSAAAVKAEQRVDKRNVTIGERVRYSITVAVPHGYTVEFLDLAEALSGFTILEEGESIRDGRTERYIEKWFIIAPYSAGDLEIPEQEIAYYGSEGDSGRVTAKACGIAVRTVLPEDTPDDFTVTIGDDVSARDVDAPIILKIFEKSRYRIAIAKSEVVRAVKIAGGVLIAIIIALFVKKGLKRKRPRVFTPYEVVTGKIAALRGKLGDGGNIRECCFALSRAVQEFIRLSFGMQMAERTTKEFMRDVGSIESLDSESKGMIRDIFSLCELVKYSGHTPELSAVTAVLDSAKRVADEIAEKTGAEKGT